MPKRSRAHPLEAGTLHTTFSCDAVCYSFQRILTGPASGPVCAVGGFGEAGPGAVIPLTDAGTIVHCVVRGYGTRLSRASGSRCNNVGDRRVSRSAYSEAVQEGNQSVATVVEDRGDIGVGGRRFAEEVGPGNAGDSVNRLDAKMGGPEIERVEGGDAHSMPKVEDEAGARGALPGRGERGPLFKAPRGGACHEQDLDDFAVWDVPHPEAPALRRSPYRFLSSEGYAAQWLESHPAVGWVIPQRASGRPRYFFASSPLAPNGRPGRRLSAALRFAQDMAPRTRPATVARTRVKVTPEDERRLLDAVEHAVRGETRALTPEETARYCETGELPERVERWAASRE